MKVDTREAPNLKPEETMSEPPSALRSLELAHQEVRDDDDPL
jgi:hypothetical protein